MSSGPFYDVPVCVWFGTGVRSAKSPFCDAKEEVLLWGFQVGV